MTRYCSIEVAAAADWDTPFLLDQYCQRELQFWKVNALKLNSKTVSHYNSKHSNYIIYSDASGTGCGAHFDLNGERVCHKQWDVYEIYNTSTWRELTAIEFALNSFLPFIKGSYIKWFSDSQTACKIVSVGSMRAVVISWCFGYKIHAWNWSYKFSHATSTRQRVTTRIYAKITRGIPNPVMT